MLSALDILGKYRTSQAEVRIVRQCNRCALVLDAEEHGHRTEKFFAKCRVLRCDIGQDSRLHKGACAWKALAAEHNLCAIGDCLLNLLDELQQRGLRRKWTVRRLLIHRIAWL